MHAIVDKTLYATLRQVSGKQTAYQELSRIARQVTERMRDQWYAQNGLRRA